MANRMIVEYLHHLMIYVIRAQREAKMVALKHPGYVMKQADGKVVTSPCLF